MYAVAIRDLKSRLSEYIRKAKEGAVILVTDRGQIVAELRAPTVRETPAQALGPLYELVNKQLLKMSSVANASENYKRSELSLPSGTATSTLNWLREDRR